MSDVVCPTPWKVSFATRGEAKSSARTASRRVPIGGQLRPYKCACGQWHLTKIPTKTQAAIRRAQRKRDAA